MTPRWCKLEELADVSLGFKSLQNNFFYVDADTIDRYQIEQEYLTPILLLRDLDTAKFLQGSTGSKSLFTCRGPERDLRGTGALRYQRERRRTAIPAALRASSAASHAPWGSPKRRLDKLAPRPITIMFSLPSHQGLAVAQTILK